ncbi:MAG: hypothetical protein NT016_01155 [Candidatus Aenigmarchaeota archaeon]|nr:hypothetical protein [Candidatus Aenigmarchaeota archaeon]
MKKTTGVAVFALSLLVLAVFAQDALAGCSRAGSCGSCSSGCGSCCSATTSPSGDCTGCSFSASCSGTSQSTCGDCCSWTAPVTTTTAAPTTTTKAPTTTTKAPTTTTKAPTTTTTQAPTTTTTLKINGQACYASGECVNYCCNGYCSNYKPAGSTCSGGSECCSTYCCNSQCSAKKPNGESCNTVDQCCSGICCNSVCASSCDACDSNSDCNDGKDCTSDICNNPTSESSTCSHGDGCDDNNLCTADQCADGTHCTHTAKNCEDSNMCTDDGCTVSTGACYNVANTADCGTCCKCSGGSQVVDPLQDSDCASYGVCYECSATTKQTCVAKAAGTACTPPTGGKCASGVCAGPTTTTTLIPYCDASYFGWCTNGGPYINAGWSCAPDSGACPGFKDYNGDCYYGGANCRGCDFGGYGCSCCPYSGGVCDYTTKQTAAQKPACGTTTCTNKMLQGAAICQQTGWVCSSAAVGCCTNADCTGYGADHTKMICECPDSSTSMASTDCGKYGQSYTCIPKGSCSVNTDCNSGYCCPVDSTGPGNTDSSCFAAINDYSPAWLCVP